MLSGKTIMITGATSGFGKSCAEQFIQSGAHVIATGRRLELLEGLRLDMGSERLHTLALDVRDESAVAQAFSDLPPAFSAISVLVNNAGLALGLDSLERMPIEDIHQMVDTNIKGLLHCTHAVLPQMIARDNGHIVNIGSIAGSYPYPGGNVYAGTKAFVKQFSLTLRADLLGKNIRVTNIEPGMADTEFSLTRFHGDRQKADAVYAGMQPLTGEDIAHTIAWCITQPNHVNINRVEIMPTMQAFSPFAVKRRA